MTNTKTLLAFVLLLASFAHLPHGATPAQAITTETLDFDVGAQCSAHDEVQNPTSVSVLFMPTTTRGEPQMSASLSVSGQPLQTAIDNRWGYPQETWHSVLFEGPAVTANSYCQSAVISKNLYVSYQPVQDVKISLSKEATLSNTELDSVSSMVKKSFLVVKPRPSHGEQYAAGRETNAPYWLTFSVPVHSLHDIQTLLQYEFP